jgi:hypothetical protein
MYEIASATESIFHSLHLNVINLVQSVDFTKIKEDLAFTNEETKVNRVSN